MLCWRHTIVILCKSDDSILRTHHLFCIVSHRNKNKKYRSAHGNTNTKINTDTRAKIQNDNLTYTCKFLPSLPSLSSPPFPSHSSHPSSSLLLPTKKARKPNTPENTNRGETIEPNTRRLFLRAGLFVEMQKGRNYETRRCSGAPLSNARDAELRVLSDRRQKESDGVTRQRQCARTRSCSGRERSSTRELAVHRNWHATCPMFIVVRSQSIYRTCFLLCGVV